MMHWLSRTRALVAVVVMVGTLLVIAGTSQRGFRIFLPSGWGLSPAGEGVAVGDMLAGGVASPDGRWIAFASVGQGIHKAYIIRRDDARIVDTTAINQDWIGVAWASDSRTLYVSGGTRPKITKLGVNAEGRFVSQDSIMIPGTERNRAWLAGLVVHGNDAFVAVSAADKLLRVNLPSGQVVGSLSFDANSTPYQLRLAPDGPLYVTLQGAAQVAEVRSDSLRVVRTISTGRHPNDLAVDGERLFVSCGNDDVVEIFDRYTGTREERVLVRPWPDAPPGSTPHALTISPDRSRMYVALSDNNAVAVLDVARRGLDHTHYTTTSMLRTMELILGATPMSQFDAAATPMYAAFRNQTDLTPYKARVPAQDLDAKNAQTDEPPLLSSIDFSEPDQLSLAQEIALNQAIWRSVKGREPYPGAVRRFGVVAVDEDDEEEARERARRGSSASARRPQSPQSQRRAP